MQDTIKNRTIFCHDNLEILQGMNSESVDLIYLDPPFNKKKIFTAPIGSSAEGASFKDIFTLEDLKEEWVQSIYEDRIELYEFLEYTKRTEGRKSYNFCYLSYMSIRLIELHRILKHTGSLYLHCDPTMSHYLKIALDTIFGESKFQNEFVWYYGGGGASKKRWARKHDIILFYSKSENWNFNADKVRIPHKWDQGQLRADGSPRNYSQGKLADDVWIHHSLMPWSKENKKYPTQKPSALLERIIQASSNLNDVILDPFCGCATTCVVAEKLNRKWIGVDVSHKAYELVKERLQTEVASHDNLFDWDKEIEFKTSPPQRTDLGHDTRIRKFVYIISNPEFPNEYKVGIANNWKSRLNSYQTSDPNRGYKLEYTILTPHFREIERHIHKTFENNHEWVQGDLGDIISEIESYGSEYTFEDQADLFVADN